MGVGVGSVPLSVSGCEIFGVLKVVDLLYFVICHQDQDGPEKVKCIANGHTHTHTTCIHTLSSNVLQWEDTMLKSTL